MGGDEGPEALPLAEGVEIEVVGEGQEDLEVGLGVGGGAGQDVPVGEELLREAGLPRAGGAAPVEVLPQEREELRERKGLQGVDDPAPRLAPDSSQDGAILPDFRDVEAVAGKGKGHGQSEKMRNLCMGSGMNRHGFERQFISDIT